MADLGHDEDIAGYVRLWPDCGLCGRAMVVGDKCVVLGGSADSIACTRSRVFSSYHDGPGSPDESAYPDAGGTYLVAPGRRVDDEDATPYEVATVHCDCLELFKQPWADPKAALDGAWIAAAWTLPWRDGPHLGIGQRPAISQVTPSVAAGLHMAGLAALPPEIGVKIQQFSSDSPLWRYILVLALSRHLSGVRSQNLSSRQWPLRRIVSWKRGEEPVLRLLDEELRQPGTLRLTIDRRGLLEIERLEKRPLYGCERSDSLVYATLGGETDAAVHLKYGFARLTCQPPDIQIWDTPAPPDPERDCVLFPNDGVLSARYHTIQLDRVRGISFLCDRNSIQAIHAHTRASPTAEHASSRIFSPVYPDMFWIYVPISPADRVLEFGVRLLSRQRNAPPDSDTYKRDLGWLFRLQLAGDVWFGQSTFQDEYEETPSTTRDFVLDSISDRDETIRHHPMTLIYRTAPFDPKWAAYFECNNITAIGALSNRHDWHHSRKEMTPPFRRTGAFLDDQDDEEWAYTMLNNDNTSVPIEPTCLWYTAAPLAGVVRIDVLHEPGTAGFCCGMLLEYANGAQRAVGDCRVGVDEVTTYVNPARLCVWHGTRPSPAGEAARRRAPWADVKMVWVVRVTCSSGEGDGGHGHGHEEGEGEGWSCYDLRGWLVFKVGGEGHYFIKVRQKP